MATVFETGLMPQVVSERLTDAFEQHEQDLRNAPDKTAEQVGQEALEWLRTNSLWIRHMFQLLGGQPQYPSSDCERVRLDEMEKILLCYHKLARAQMGDPFGLEKT